jgi:hypothetical protein
MKKAITLAALLVLLPPALSAQLRLNGYFSSDYTQALSRGSGQASSFNHPEAGLIISGEWSAQFNYVLEARTGAGFKAEIDQAWMGWNYSEAFHIKLGVFFVPFGRTNDAHRPFQTMLVSWPYPYGDAHPARWREIGAQLEGRTGVFRYAAWIGNGLAESETLAGGQQLTDNNKNKAFGARLAVGLSQELEIGGSYYRGRQDAADGRSLLLYGADAAWLTRNIRCTAEYVRADIDNPAAFSRGRAEGWNVQLGLNFGQFTPVASYSKSKTNDPFHGAGWAADGTAGAGILADRERWALGAAYAPHPNLLIKLEYDIDKDTLLGRKDNVLRGQAAVRF